MIFMIIPDDTTRFIQIHIIKRLQGHDKWSQTQLFGEEFVLGQALNATFLSSNPLSTDCLFPFSSLTVLKTVAASIRKS